MEKIYKDASTQFDEKDIRSDHVDDTSEPVLISVWLEGRKTETFEVHTPVLCEKCKAKIIRKDHVDDVQHDSGKSSPEFDERKRNWFFENFKLPNFISRNEADPKNALDTDSGIYNPATEDSASGDVQFEVEEKKNTFLGFKLPQFHSVNDGPAESIKNTATYTIQIKTGLSTLSETNVPAFMYLQGSDGIESDRIELEKSETNIHGFLRDQVDVFNIQAKNVGKINKIRIRHDNSGTLPGWFIEYVEIKTDIEELRFTANKWISSENPEVVLEPDHIKKSDGNVEDQRNPTKGFSFGLNLPSFPFKKTKTPESDIEELLPEPQYIEAEQSPPELFDILGDMDGDDDDDIVATVDSGEVESQPKYLDFDIPGFHGQDEQKEDIVIAAHGFDVESAPPMEQLEVDKFGQPITIPEKDKIMEELVEPSAAEQKDDLFHFENLDAEHTEYLVYVQTGNTVLAGTDSRVSIYLHGDIGESEQLNLNSSSSESKKPFQRNQRDKLSVTTFRVGDISKLRVVHDKEGLFSGWNLKNITVQHPPSQKEWRFEADQWMDGNEIELFPVSDLDEIQPSLDVSQSADDTTNTTIKPSTSSESIEDQESPNKDDGKNRSWFLRMPRFPGSSSDEKNKQPKISENDSDNIDGSSNVSPGEQDAESGNKFGFNINLPKFNWRSGNSEDKINDVNSATNDESIEIDEKLDENVPEDKPLEEKSRSGFGLKFPQMPSINLRRKKTEEPQENLGKDEIDESESFDEIVSSSKGSTEETTESKDEGFSDDAGKGSKDDHKVAEKTSVDGGLDKRRNWFNWKPNKAKEEAEGNLSENSMKEAADSQPVPESSQPELGQKKSSFKFGFTLPKISMPTFNSNVNNDDIEEPIVDVKHDVPVETIPDLHSIFPELPDDDEPIVPVEESSVQEMPTSVDVIDIPDDINSIPSTRIDDKESPTPIVKEIFRGAQIEDDIVIPESKSDNPNLVMIPVKLIYKITIRTGEKPLQGADDTMPYIYLTGEDEKTSERKELKLSNNQSFRSNGTDIYFVEEIDLGELLKIRIECTGLKEPWSIIDVLVEVSALNVSWFFPVDQELTQDISEIEAHFPSTGDENNDSAASRFHLKFPNFNWPQFRARNKMSEPDTKIDTGEQNINKNLGEDGQPPTELSYENDSENPDDKNKKTSKFGLKLPTFHLPRFGNKTVDNTESDAGDEDVYVDTMAGATNDKHNVVKYKITVLTGENPLQCVTTTGDESTSVTEETGETAHPGGFIKGATVESPWSDINQSVYIRLYGNEKETENFELHRIKSDVFSTNKEDVFFVDQPEMGELQKLAIGCEQLKTPWSLKSIKVEIPSTKASWFFPIGQDITAEYPEYVATAYVDSLKGGQRRFNLPSINWPTVGSSGYQDTEDDHAEEPTEVVDHQESIEVTADEDSNVNASLPEMPVSRYKVTIKTGEKPLQYKTIKDSDSPTFMEFAAVANDSTDKGNAGNDTTAVTAMDPHVSICFIGDKSETEHVKLPLPKTHRFLSNSKTSYYIEQVDFGDLQRIKVGCNQVDGEWSLESVTITTPSRKSPWFFHIGQDITAECPECEATPGVNNSKDSGFNFKLPSLNWPTFGSEGKKSKNDEALDKSNEDIAADENIAGEEISSGDVRYKVTIRTGEMPLNYKIIFDDDTSAITEETPIADSSDATNDEKSVKSPSSINTPVFIRLVGDKKETEEVVLPVSKPDCFSSNSEDTFFIDQVDVGDLQKIKIKCDQINGRWNLESVKVEIPSTKASWVFPIGQEITSEAPEYEAAPDVDVSKDGRFNFKLPSLNWPTFGSEGKKPKNDEALDKSNEDIAANENIAGEEISGGDVRYKVTIRTGEMPLNYKVIFDDDTSTITEETPIADSSDATNDEKSVKSPSGINTPVFIRLFGDKKETEEVVLPVSKPDCFSSNSEDTFFIDQVDVGDLQKIKIKCDQINGRWNLESVKVEIPSTKASWVFPIGQEITPEAPEYEAAPDVDVSKDGRFNFKLPSLNWPTFGSEGKKHKNDEALDKSNEDIVADENIAEEEISGGDVRYKVTIRTGEMPLNYKIIFDDDTSAITEETPIADSSDATNDEKSVKSPSSINTLVFIRLFGDKKETEEVVLPVSKPDCFSSNSEDTFFIDQVDVGDLQKIRVGCDQIDGTWKLESVKIEIPSSKALWFFPFGQEITRESPEYDAVPDKNSSKDGGFNIKLPSINWPTFGGRGNDNRTEEISQKETQVNLPQQKDSDNKSGFKFGFSLPKLPSLSGGNKSHADEGNVEPEAVIATESVVESSPPEDGFDIEDIVVATSEVNVESSVPDYFGEDDTSDTTVKETPTPSTSATDDDRQSSRFRLKFPELSSISSFGWKSTKDQENTSLDVDENEKEAVNSEETDKSVIKNHEDVDNETTPRPSARFSLNFPQLSLPRFGGKKGEAAEEVASVPVEDDIIIPAVDEDVEATPGAIPEVGALGDAEILQETDTDNLKNTKGRNLSFKLPEFRLPVFGGRQPKQISGDGDVNDDGQAAEKQTSDSQDMENENDANKEQKKYDGDKDKEKTEKLTGSKTGFSFGLKLPRYGVGGVNKDESSEPPENDVSTENIEGEEIIPQIEGGVEAEPSLPGDDAMTTYKLYVKTGKENGSGTNANVYVYLSGTNGAESEKLILEHSETNRNKFERNQLDVFEVEIPDIGRLKKIRVGHDNKGGFAAWYLEYVLVEEFVTGKRLKFESKKWIDKKNGLEVELLPPGVSYQIVVHTSDIEGADTYANIVMSLVGESGEESEERPLTESNEAREKNFKRNSVDVFVRDFQDVGTIKQLRVRFVDDVTDPSNENDSAQSWHLNKVILTRLFQYDEAHSSVAPNLLFECDVWFGANSEDGVIVKEFEASKMNDLFRQLTSKTIDIQNPSVSIETKLPAATVTMDKTARTEDLNDTNDDTAHEHFNVGVDESVLPSIIETHSTTAPPLTTSGTHSVKEVFYIEEIIEEQTNPDGTKTTTKTSRPLSLSEIPNSEDADYIMIESTESSLPDASFIMETITLDSNNDVVSSEVSKSGEFTDSVRKH